MFDAKLVPEPKASEIADATIPASVLRGETPEHVVLTKQLVILLKEVGRLKTGREVEFAWCWSAAQIAAQQRMGVLDFDLGQEVNPKAIRAVMDVAAEALKALKREQLEADQDDIPF